MTNHDTPLAEFDPEIARLLDAELHRQQSTLEMIASENHAPLAVMEAQGSVLTNKYAEGYPGKRYYGGCEHIDVSEQLAIDRAKEIFGADHANVLALAGRRLEEGNAAEIVERFLGTEFEGGRHQRRVDQITRIEGGEPPAAASSSGEERDPLSARDTS